MSEKISITVPHRLSKEEARQRIDGGFVRLQQEIAGKSVEFDQSWQGDVMAFSGGAMGQTITGRLTVADNAVDIELDLPWLLAKLSGTIRDKLSRGATKMLEKK